LECGNNDESKDLLTSDTTDGGTLPIHSPLVWPDPRCLTGQNRYAVQPPFDDLVRSSDLVAGMFLGVSEKTIGWIERLLKERGERRVLLVVVVFPAGPTRERHLAQLKSLAESRADQQLQVKVIPVARAFGSDFERIVLPPTVIEGHNSKTGKTHLCIGSVGDAGRDEYNVASFNVVFQPDDGLRDHFRRWFQFLWSTAAQLTADTVQVPHLTPAPGDKAAAEMWSEFEAVCSGRITALTLDEETGEVTSESDGSEVKPWDEGKTSLDPLAQMLQRIYASGWLATVDETTRIKPLRIPVKATLLGQISERTLGTVTRKQSFTLTVLDDEIDTKVDQYRKANDIISLLSYPISKGSHWIPDSAKTLCDKELDEKNKKGLECLRSALGGLEVPQFVEKRKEKVRKDLDAMYVELGQGTSVPEDRLPPVYMEIENRLSSALSNRITPRAVYNRLSPPDLTRAAPNENWSQPLALLLCSARVMRESLTDPYYTRKLNGRGFGMSEFQAAMDIFGDSILKSPSLQRAKAELASLTEIEEGELPFKEKCNAVWKIITAH
jgi:hypothetical protein